MRINYLATAILPSRAANSVHVMRMCDAFAMHGHEVTLTVPNRAERDRLESDLFAYYGTSESFRIEVGPWPSVRGRSLVFALNSAHSARREKPDLVYGRMLEACAVAAYLGLPTVFEAHAPVSERGRIANWLFGLMIRQPSFRHLVVISQALREQFRLDFPELGSRIRVAPDAANPPESSLASKQQNGSGNLQVGYVGSLYRGRGIDLIETMAIRCPWADFHLVGGSDPEIEELRQKGLPKNLFCHGYCQPSLVSQRLAGFDMLLAPYQRQVAVFGGTGDTSRWMSPLKIFEYMAVGKPILASDLPVLREVLNDDNSVLVSPDDPEQWIAALERLRSVDLRKRLGERAFDDFKSKYTWEARVKAVLP